MMTAVQPDIDEWRATQNGVIVETVTITMSDGVRLSARLWRPEEGHAVPAILEFIPYRKSDATAIRDHRLHHWMAARGYACLRADMRGSGDSGGIMEDEYLPREQEDAVEIIAWLADRPWCDGAVGMMGLSWGGIAALQAAVNRPPALKAVIAVGASIDRYYDDGGYFMGGYPGQGLGWGGTMFGFSIRPPDPAVFGDGWREMWLRRIDETPVLAETWLSHPLRDETWVRGSVCEHLDRIEVPVLGISGWNDCWPNTLLRLVERLSAPCRVVSGPWGHVYPNLGGPGPTFGFLQLAKRWWDRWLKGEANSVMREPALLAYVMESHPPDPAATDRPGRWVSEAGWPSPRVQTVALYPVRGALIAAPGETGETAQLRSSLTTGLGTGEYMPMSGTAELPHDQREDDAKSLSFDTEPLAEPLQIFGTPRLALTVASDGTEGLLAARLCDMAPDGRSTLITFGILNLALREGRNRSVPLVPGQRVDVTVRLNDVAYELQPGHRLRLAVSTNLWPMAWPLASSPVLMLPLDRCRLDLPVRDAPTEPAPPSTAEPALAGDPPPHHVHRPAKGSRRISHDIGTGTTVYEVTDDRGEFTLNDTGLTFGSITSQRYEITEGDPLSARITYCADYSYRRERWSARCEGALTVTCTATDFVLTGRIAAFEGDVTLRERDWTTKIPRIAY